MDKDNITAYAKRELEKGFSRKDVKKTLLKAGHKKERVESALKEVYARNPHLKPSKTWLRFVYFLIVAAIIALAVVYVPKIKLPAEMAAPKVEAVSIADCNSILDNTERNNCFLNLAIKHSDASYCNNDLGCIYALVNITKNLAYCGGITDGTTRLLCKFNFANDEQKKELVNSDDSYINQSNLFIQNVQDCSFYDLLTEENQFALEKYYPFLDLKGCREFAKEIDLSLKNMCLLNFAMFGIGNSPLDENGQPINTTENINACNLIGKGFLNTFCLARVNFQQPDCEKFSSINEKELCGLLQEPLNHNDATTVSTMREKLNSKNTPYLCFEVLYGFLGKTRED